MAEVKKETSIPTAVTNSKKRREDKVRRRDYRALENILKSISTLPESEKFQALSNKYGELYEEYRTIQTSSSAAEKRCTILQRENDQLQSELKKCILARSRMENLCRELQRQNKIIKEENLTKIREEEERRKEVAAKFQITLNEITSRMEENSEKNIKLRDDNIDMSNKIASICEQFEQREQQLNRINKQMELERQLSETTIAKYQFELQSERELWGKEREALLNKLKDSEETCAQLQLNVKALEEHLQLYTGKYEEFESTISKSNRVFDNCKSEMLKMSKQINTLEKEAKTWKLRWQKNAQSLLELSTTKQTQDADLAAAEKKLEQLQKLCRQLQVDRAAYLKLLKSNGIEPSSQICIDDHPPVQTNVQKNSKKEQNLEILKNNLKVLQDQLSVIQLDKGTTSDAENIDNIPIAHFDCAPTEIIAHFDCAPTEIIDDNPIIAHFDCARTEIIDDDTPIIAHCECAVETIPLVTDNDTKENSINNNNDDENSNDTENSTNG